MLEVREDASPWLEWPGARLRLYRGCLLLSRVERVLKVAATPSVQAQPQLQSRLWHWQREPELVIAGVGTLALCEDSHGDLDLSRLPATLSLRWPRSGEARVAGQSERTLRKRLQQLAVPVWERDGLPLLCDAAAMDAGRVIAIADCWLDPQLLASPDAPHRARFEWRPLR
jgi:tRNA(Ile)-lysidine synthetase-like protein